MLSITKKLETLTDQDLLMLSKAINQELVSREDPGEENLSGCKVADCKKLPLRAPHLQNERKSKR